MASGAYSFIDIAVLEAVRARFAAGDALAILSVDLDEVIWANGPGARLFGYPDIEAIMGAPAGLGPAARRQIAAMRGFPAVSRDTSVMVRLASGLASGVVGFLASGIALPDGEAAVLLALPARDGASRGPRDIAERAISGFTEAGHFAALVDRDGSVLAASDGFGGLGVSSEAIRRLVEEVAGEQDRLVKRPVDTGAAAVPAGIARLTDDPARHLLVLVDEAEAEWSPPEFDLSALPRRQPAASASGPEETAIAAQDTVHAPPAEEEPGDFSPPGNGPEAQDDADAPPAQPEPAQAESPGPEDADAPAAEESAASPAPRQAPAAGPVRFAWRTDAEGCFAALSEEFSAAVGPEASDVIGRRFRDVATAFALDPDGDIAGLLERRDTWSGRSVLWPVSGTDLKVPVDLAALPVYARDRSFEGFRGFGVARMDDAVVDPEAIGLALTRAPVPAPAEKAGEEPSADGPGPAGDDDPFLGEVPALAVSESPDRRLSDKVIRLAEHRSAAPEKNGLSAGERTAFREIGDRLKSETGEEAGEPETALAEDSPVAANDTGEETAAPSREDRPPAAKAEADGDEAAGVREDEAPGTMEPSGDTPASEPPTDDDAAGEPDAAPEAELSETPPSEALREEAPREQPAVVPAPPLRAAGFLPSAFAVPGRREDSGTALVDRLPMPVLVHSGDVLHFANRELLSLTGYGSVEELAAAGGIGALFADPYDGSGEGEARRTLSLVDRDGRAVPVDAWLQSAPWRRGNALLLALRPIEEPPGALSASQEERDGLQARLEELRTIVDTATDGVVLLDRDGMIRTISRPAEALFGFDGDEIAGKAFTSLFAIESQRGVRDYMNGLTDNGVASVLNDGREVIGRESQGRFIPLFMTLGMLPDGSGFCAVLRDVTQWKRAEEELTQARGEAEHASSQKTEFLARVSHEIRTPLNAIIGFSELMIDEKFGPIANDRYRDYLRDINRSGNHVLDLVNDLLDISKIEAGEQEMIYVAVSLNDTLAETVAMMQPQANRDRVIIRSSFASRLPEVVADLRSMRQIILNLLSNAIRYTQAGGQVVVSTSYEPTGDIVMRVRDTGIGMSSGEIEQALKPFKQINALKRPRGDGTGLGLPLTKAMVEANRARFAISSTPGVGTLVEVTFPSTRVLAD